MKGKCVDVYRSQTLNSILPGQKQTTQTLQRQVRNFKKTLETRVRAKSTMQNTQGQALNIDKKKISVERKKKKTKRAMVHRMV